MGKAKETPSSSAENTCSEISIVNTQPPAELPGSQQPPASNGRSKAVLVLSALLTAALLALGCTLCRYIQTKESLRKLEDEHNGEKISLMEGCYEPRPSSTSQPPKGKARGTKINETWEEHGGKCYYFSSSRAAWNKSQRGCRKMGGDLVKIDSKEEQKFLENILKEKMDQPEDKFWIGLTDSKEEGKWLWVDDSLLEKSLTFWSDGEPDNWKGEDPDGEDCVRMGEKGGRIDLKIWFDKSCKTPHKSICEKKKKKSVKTRV